RDHFDPSGLETSRAFGLKLATAAPASFFDAAKAPGRGRRT
ncbi:VirC2 family conjugal transfer protein, partial [Pseudomonas sp. BGM005]|nr:VirC2 family conjugal transfer protein [Pseudomonas sp. BG5]